MLFSTTRSTISAQKVVDKYNEPEKNILPNSFQEKRIVSHPMHGYCLAELKLTTAGTPSTMAAANYYSEKSKQRRDELLAKFNNNMEAAAETQ
jgi:hypothetical protein